MQPARRYLWTHPSIHKYIKHSPWMIRKQEGNIQTADERNEYKKIMVHKLRSDGSEWEGSESEHTREKKRRARDEMERER